MPESPGDITVIAHFTARQARESELLNLLHSLLGPTRKEEGCLRYELNQEIENPRCFTLAEKFRSVADYEAHLSSKHVRQFSERAAHLIESRVVRIHRELLPSGSKEGVHA